MISSKLVNIYVRILLLKSSFTSSEFSIIETNKNQITSILFVFELQIYNFSMHKFTNIYSSNIIDSGNKVKADIHSKKHSNNPIWNVSEVKKDRKHSDEMVTKEEETEEDGDVKSVCWHCKTNWNLVTEMKQPIYLSILQIYGNRLKNCQVCFKMYIQSFKLIYGPGLNI